MRLAWLSLALIASCAASAAHADTITVPRPVPWAADAEIAGKIQRECTLQTQLADFIQIYAQKQGQTIAFADKVDETTPGKVLILEIRDAVSEGNAFIGHHKSTSVRGRLIDNGQVIGSFRAKRNSMGGAFAGYKGSCSVLGRTVKALGEDIAQWLSAPSLDAQLGDLK